MGISGEGKGHCFALKTEMERMEVATLGGGCFWCLDAVFLDLEGVQSVRSGYSGGDVPDPNYDEVCRGTTGHAEVVQVEFDPSVTAYREILEVFFAVHDPTTLNRQGADVGSQYRSIVLYHSEEQNKIAQQVIKELDSESIWSDPIVTELQAFDVFYSAEAYHQEYFENNPNQGYCRMVITPKVEKFEKFFKEKLK
jgi:peptide-methionine (S)-S-oxide reductase